MITQVALRAANGSEWLATYHPDRRQWLITASEQSGAMAYRTISESERDDLLRVLHGRLQSMVLRSNVKKSVPVLEFIRIDPHCGDSGNLLLVRLGDVIASFDVHDASGWVFALMPDERDAAAAMGAAPDEPVCMLCGRVRSEHGPDDQCPMTRRPDVPGADTANEVQGCNCPLCTAREGRQ